MVVIITLLFILNNCVLFKLSWKFRNFARVWLNVYFFLISPPSFFVTLQVCRHLLFFRAGNLKKTLIIVFHLFLFSSIGFILFVFGLLDFSSKYCVLPFTFFFFFNLCTVSFLFLPCSLEGVCMCRCVHVQLTILSAHLLTVKVPVKVDL